MEYTPAGVGLAAPRETTRVRPAARAVAATTEHARRIRCACSHVVPATEIRMGPAHGRIPVPDVHRIPAVLCNPGPVHRQLERPAARADHDLYRPRLPAANPADSQRHRGATRRLSFDRDHDQFWRRCGDRSHLRRDRHAEACGSRRAGRDLEFPSYYRPGGDVRDPHRGWGHRVLDNRRGVDRAAGLCRTYFYRGAFCHTDHHRPPARTQRARRFRRARVLDLAVGTYGWLPVIAAADRGPDPERALAANGRSAHADGLIVP